MTTARRALSRASTCKPDLDHGYAITAHRAQGATVERTFVLGSQELYREWAYTALSRHKEQARFYVADSDLHLDREQPPLHDPLIAGLTQLLQRSQAKELALESLPLAQRQQLEDGRRDFRDHLSSPPAPARFPRAEHVDPRPQLDQLVAVDRELRVRDIADHCAVDHLRNLNRYPLGPNRRRGSHDPEIDFGR